MNTPKFAYMLNNAMLFKLEICMNILPSQLINLVMQLKNSFIMKKSEDRKYIHIYFGMPTYLGD